MIRRAARDPSAVKNLIEHFCKERWLQRPLNRQANFELHAHKRFTMDNYFVVNSWVRNKTGSVESEPIALVEQDINTLPEEAETRSFSTDETVRFFRAVVPELDLILSLYYPRGTRA